MPEPSTAYIHEAKNEAEDYLGRSITDAEWDEALPQAQRKLDYIIGREGDADGERRKPYYLGKLVEESISISAFSKWLDAQNELNREMAKKKEAASLRRQPLTQPHYTPSATQKSIPLRFKEETI